MNDVIITKVAAIFTDSGSAFREDRLGTTRLFIVPLNPAERTLPDENEVIELPVQMESPGDLDITFANLNGIETVPGDSSKVLVCHQSLGKLFQVDIHTGYAIEMEVMDPEDLGEEPYFSTCDGLVRNGNMMYVIQNRDTVVSAVRVSPDGSTGKLTKIYDLKQIIGDEIDTPTTGDIYGNHLYVVDPQFRNPVAEEFNMYRFELMP